VLHIYTSIALKLMCASSGWSFRLHIHVGRVIHVFYSTDTHTLILSFNLVKYMHLVIRKYLLDDVSMIRVYMHLITYECMRTY
jgi:hypothetical protein